jgi:16S rRNA (adenine1518-N6/adenine1519-N6)-dimethyltransferase
MIKPKQSLGQNFLIDENISRKIVKFISPYENDIILEIGVGKGALTKFLLEKAKFLIGVEIDNRLSNFIQETFSKEKNFKFIHQDFLKIEIPELIKKLNFQKIRIVGNLPYSITSPVIFKLIENRQFISDVILMIQKEVAERIVSKHNSKDYGILSVLCQFYADVEVLFYVSKNVFFPKPKVDSSVIKLKFFEKPVHYVKDEDFFKKVVKTAFNQRRKMLRASLKQLEEWNKLKTEITFDLTKRPEQLTIRDFVEISNLLKEVSL